MSQLTLGEVYEMVVSAPNVSDATLDEIIDSSDPQFSKAFYGSDKDMAKERVKAICLLWVKQVLNNPDPKVVPIRKKTKFLLAMNNFALSKSVRSSVFKALGHMNSIFEDAMKKEGTMPFDSELGRMSEHVLVLLMRVCNYKLKAAQALEFAEGNTQFGVQLLLAILLKEPPYEFELRCNCISGLLGFTQPQAFFQPDDKIEFNGCEKFCEKVDFVLNLCLRLNAIQVVNDVLSAPLLEEPKVPLLVHVAVCNAFRCIMNIYHFASPGASTEWRQHILLSTSFVDSVTILYLQGQIRDLQNIAAPSRAIQPPPGLLPGITLALKFLAFATFHMGIDATTIRPLCGFAHDLLNLEIGPSLVTDAALRNGLCSLYTQLWHFLGNIEALAGDDGVADDPEDLIPELRSDELRDTIRRFLRSELQPLGSEVVSAWHTKFFIVDGDALVSQDSTTYGIINELFTVAVSESVCTSRQQGRAPRPAERTLLGDMPSLERKFSGPKPGERPQWPAQATFQVALPPKRQQPAQEAPSRFVCALNGHVMKNPVTTPYGHTFERSTIEQWLRQQGSVCPLTGKPLNAEDLRPDRQLAAEIMQALVQQTMHTDNQEDEVDLYDF